MYYRNYRYGRYSSRFTRRGRGWAMRKSYTPYGRYYRRRYW